MTCLEIIKTYLKENGFDGLVHPDGDCACSLAVKDDLINCCFYMVKDGNIADCKPTKAGE